MNDWELDKKWSDQFVPEIKGILGLHLIAPAPMEEDAEHNTDLITLKMDSLRIACRIRKHHYVLNSEYADQFTVRCERTSGAKTELAKILEGWGDYIFYGFSDEHCTQIAAWFLGNLNVFRLWFHKETIHKKGVIPGEGKLNKDGFSKFRAFNINQLPEDFIMARKIYVGSAPTNGER